MNALSIARCSVALPSAGNTVQLLPAGTFKTGDGRPEGLEAWRIDQSIANSLVARASSRKNRFVIDYEHQTLEKPTGEVRAAGWFKNFEWREGEGLFATDVEWTAAASQMIKAGEYRYLSPVFRFDPTSGEVLEIVSAGITNTPALDGMQELAALRRFMAEQTDPEGSRLADDIAALIERSQRDRSEITALRRHIDSARLDEVIETALNEARLLPGQVEAARRVGAADIEALTALLHRPPLVAALTGMQSDRIRQARGHYPGDGVPTPSAVTREEARIAALSGRTPSEYAELKRRYADEDSGLID